jgi:hypothetical protein
MAMQALPPAEARVIRTPAHAHETVNTKENGVLPCKFVSPDRACKITSLGLCTVARVRPSKSSDEYTTFQDQKIFL